MELEHLFTVPASIEQTWAAFNDPAQVAPCFPGATLISVNGDEFTGSAKIKLGPIALQYNGVGTYVERDESAHRAVIEAKGKDKRGNGTAKATVTARMEADGAGTAVHVTTDLAVTGKPAQFGRGVMQDVSDKLLMQFVACLRTKLGAGQQAPADDTQPAQPVDAVQPGQPAEPAQPGLVEAVIASATDGAPTATPQGVPGNGAAAPRTGTSSTPAPAYRQDSSTVPKAHTALTAPTEPAADVELHLLGTIGRVLLTRYAARALGPVALIVGYLLGRRARR